MTTDLLGTPLTPAETDLLAAYDTVKALVARDDLPPAAISNARVALAALGIAVADLAIEFEHLIDAGV
ncbi:hypothetical protein [Microbacterium sp. SORGH_AS_0888]|uniref:hypothetical protein n=1 Tax=Microbacterium sp. SORGH_AS_0888 TaxID=3041791 RepID=UPI0027827C5F|nr:hypothetical protein [Microbacterium sp. SORGH_AS_0888]MDQ1128725.1 hypothetical protein [Microbacterium sp. SORGH_AS_0888]